MLSIRSDDASVIKCSSFRSTIFTQRKCRSVEIRKARSARATVVELAFSPPYNYFKSRNIIIFPYVVHTNQIDNTNEKPR